MNKKKLKQIYKTLSKLRKHDNKIDKSLRNFLNTIAPGIMNYTFVEKDSFSGAQEMLETIYGEGFTDDTSYWFFECDEGRRTLSGTDKDGNIYEFNKLNNYLDFLEVTNRY